MTKKRPKTPSNIWIPSNVLRDSSISVLEAIVEFLKEKPIIIWGARMTGMGFLRFSTSNDLNVINFVDSDREQHLKFNGRMRHTSNLETQNAANIN